LNVASVSSSIVVPVGYWAHQADPLSTLVSVAAAAAPPPAATAGPAAPGATAWRWTGPAAATPGVAVDGAPSGAGPDALRCTGAVPLLPKALFTSVVFPGATAGAAPALALSSEPCPLPR
jgi:hypothetical protein